MSSCAKTPRPPIISIHALREEGDYAHRQPYKPAFCISIHALREEGDLHGALSDAVPGAFLSTPSARRATPYPPDREQVSQISIHALREEGDLPAVRPPLGDSKFLSTPSARRATTDPRSEGGLPHDFYPRPPRGGRPSPLHLHFIFLLFLSTPSARRATMEKIEKYEPRVISIHALREEGDGLTSPTTPPIPYFYPRPPRGGRPGSTENEAKH